MMRRLSRAAQILRVWGTLGFVRYTLSECLFLAITYQISVRVFPRSRRRSTKLVAGLVAASVFLLVYRSSGMAGVAALFGIAVILLGGVLLWRYLKLVRMIKQARAMMVERKNAEASNFTLWQDWPVQEKVRAKIEATRQANPHAEIVLAHLNRDGRAVTVFGPLPEIESVSSSGRNTQGQYVLDIVLVDEFVLVRKDFRGNRKAFVREWHNLAHLQGIANTPGVYLVNETRCILYKNLVWGRTLRDLLVEKGAAILLSQTQNDVQLEGFSPDRRIEEVWARGRKLLGAILPDAFFDLLEEQINIIHALGIAKLSLTFGNIMVGASDARPWLIDFEKSEHFSSTDSIFFRFHRDQDREKYNRIYDRHILTEKLARTVIRNSIKQGDPWYAPVNFGHGFTAGPIWHIESGTGRWETINARVLPPLIKGKRILDLGSNNGLMPLLMLRNGAEQVIGLEVSSAYYNQAMLIHRLFEWRDIRVYDFMQCNCDMLEILEREFGPIDIVTSYCSLYYLSEPDMASVVCRAAQIAPIIVVQANATTRAAAPEGKALKSSTGYLRTLLEANGFPRIEVFGQDQHPRPLLIGRRK